MSRLIVCVTTVAMLGSAIRARAQQPWISGPIQSRLPTVAPKSDTIPRQAVVSNWQEPALVGGAVLGGLGGLVGYGFCADYASDNSACALKSEFGFLASAAFGGLIAGLIGSTSTPRTPPPGYEVHGDRRLYGALMLAAPSFAAEAYGFSYQCRHRYSFGSDGCDAGNALLGLLSVAFNAWLGSQIGKAIPAFRAR